VGRGMGLGRWGVARHWRRGSWQGVPVQIPATTELGRLWYLAVLPLFFVRLVAKVFIVGSRIYCAIARCEFWLWQKQTTVHACQCQYWDDR
jgi:hypothetical protein